MPYAPHNRIVVSGTFVGAGGVTAEIWSFSLCDDSANAPADLVPLIVQPLTDWFRGNGSAPSYANTGTNMTLIRVEAVDATGKVTNSYGTDVNVAGSLVTNNLPFICCACMTLETQDLEPSGRTIRGRFYPPNNGLSATGNGFGANMGATLAASGASLLTALNAAGAKIVVASQKAGKNAVVTSVSADNVVDTQRRRKNASIGVRGAHDLPYAP